MNQFNLYSDIILDAFNMHTKQKEIIERKQEIIEKIWNGAIIGLGAN